MFLLQSGLPSFAWAIIGTVIGIISLLSIAIIGFTIFIICKNWKRMQRNNRNVEKIIAKLADDNEAEN